MDFSFSNLAAGIVFGSFGLYAVKRGKKNSNLIDILIGVTLLVYPYFIDNALINWGLGTALLILLYRFRK